MRYTFLRFPFFKDKAVTLSYDDGLSTDERLIKILDKYGLRCTFNLNSGLFAKSENERRMTVNKAKELFSNSNHEVAVHGYRHFDMVEVSNDMATRDIIDDRVFLEKTFGRIVKGMAYPNGSYNDECVEILKNCGIKYARTIESSGNFDIPADWLRLKPTCRHADPKLNEYLDKFLQDDTSKVHWKNKPKLFYLWGHTFEFITENDWKVIESFAERVGNREDVWCATGGEIYDYVKSFDRLEFSADGTIIRNDSGVDIYMYYFGKNIVVKANSVYKAEIEDI